MRMFGAGLMRFAADISKTAMADTARVLVGTGITTGGLYAGDQLNNARISMMQPPARTQAFFPSTTPVKKMEKDVGSSDLEKTRFPGAG